jgi:cobalt-zinc-cadmium efflux system outer membrane protein
LRDDVARRYQAGDLARADLNQAEGALAQARAAQAEARAGAAQARYRLENLTGLPAAEEPPVAEPEPLAPAGNMRRSAICRGAGSWRGAMPNWRGCRAGPIPS